MEFFSHKYRILWYNKIHKMLAFHQPVYKSIVNEEIEMPKNKSSAQKFQKQNV
jgi:hypothetical protein